MEGVAVQRAVSMEVTENGGPGSPLSTTSGVPASGSVAMGNDDNDGKSSSVVIGSSRRGPVVVNGGSDLREPARQNLRPPTGTGNGWLYMCEDLLTYLHV